MSDHGKGSAVWYLQEQLARTRDEREIYHEGMCEAVRLLRDYEASYPHGRLGEAARAFFAKTGGEGV
jgi:hypothetical protein